MKQIFRFLIPYKKQMIQGFSIKVFATLVELVIPWALGKMIDVIVPTGRVLYIALWGGFMLLCAVTALITNVSANRRASLVARNATERIRLELFTKISFMSSAEQEKVTGASLISRATSDTYNVHQFLGMMQRLGVRQPCMLLGSLVITLFLDVPLTLVMLAMMPIMAAAVFVFCKYGVPMFGKVQKSLDRFVSIVREDISGIRVIKALSKTEAEKKRFEEINMEVVKRDQKANTVMGAMHPVVNIILNVGLVLVILFGAYRVNAGFTKPGTILAFMTYVTTILNAILFMSRIFLMYSRASASGNRITEILNTENDLTVQADTESPKEEAKRAEEGRIIFDHVSFSYGTGGKVLSDVSFSLKRGETLGIIGATGAGKSTIVNLMMRYYDADAGRIYIDGKDIRTYEDWQLKEKFGLVHQNDVIFHDTLEENIRFGRDLSEAELMKACETAQGAFMKERGLSDLLAIKGANLSGGQKQRVYIARALAASPEILVLDDSSSALDFQTDANLRRDIRKNYENTTMVIVAQRVSSIQDADRILVMDEGELIGVGNHAELMKSCEVYREIAESQMGPGHHLNPERERKQAEELKKKYCNVLHTLRDDVDSAEILRRVEENQELYRKHNMNRECMDVVRKQKEKEQEKTKDLNKRGTLRRLMKYLMRYRGWLVLAAVMTLLANGLGLLGPMLSGYAIDYISPGVGAVDFQKVFSFCGLMLIVYVASSLFAYGQNLVMIQITRRIVSGIRREMFERLLNLKVNFFDTHSAGDVISRITYDVDTMNTSLSGDVVALFSSLVTVTGSFVMMVVISPVLVLIFAVTIPITILFTRFLAGITRPLFRARSGKLGELNGFIEEMISGQKSLKAYHQQIHTIQKFQKQNEDAVNAYYRADYMAAFVGPSVNCLSNLSLVLVTVFGAVLYMMNMISLGNISSFMLYSRKFSGPINESANIISELQSAIAAAERVFRMLDEPEEMPLSEHEQVLSEVRGDVAFSHVGFGYSSEKQILHDLTLRAEAGKRIAIVGPTGAGKTTIINLLMRFYDIESGQIFVDGVETREYTRDSLRKAFAMVLQDTWLFHGTVYENVAYGREGATREEVIEVCKAAKIHRYIMRLPDQYDTVLSDEGSNISKGQKQLLTIARAMLSDAKMLILDEATSNVDTRTELALQKAMDALMKNKTCFVIAHRLSTIRDADCILVVRDGDVVETGTHDELMQKGGFYRDLYEAQWSRGEAL